jgi:hypothetical protein
MSTINGMPAPMVRRAANMGGVVVSCNLIAV